MEGTIGEIRMFGGNFAPRGWAFCNGSLMSIAVYSTAYSLIGTTYGGDGNTTFALPDLRGRVPIGTGQQVPLGMMSGTENVTMIQTQMPAHTHIASATVQLPAYSETGSSASPNGNILCTSPTLYTTEVADTNLKPFTVTAPISITGNGIPFNIMQPYMALSYIICLEGIFPSRN